MIYSRPVFKINTCCVHFLALNYVSTYVSLQQNGAAVISLVSVRCGIYIRTYSTRPYSSSTSAHKDINYVGSSSYVDYFRPCRSCRDSFLDCSVVLIIRSSFVPAQTFHSLRAKESHYKRQLQKKSWEMETMRQHMQQVRVM